MSEAVWEAMWDEMHDLYMAECERSKNLRDGLLEIAAELDEIGETRLGKVARARAANA